MLETRILSTNDPQAIPTAVQIIDNQGLVAFPTDTLYGVAASPFNTSAIEKIFLAKQRPRNKALPILIGDLNQLETLVSFISDRVKIIAETFWPGALTLILPKHPSLPTELSSFPTVGIRMPNLDFTLKLLRQTGPLATTSANISGGIDPTTAAEVLTQLGGRVDLILDGGTTPGGVASTILAVTNEEMIILRRGPVALSDIEALFEEI
jgi:L-threonylcarbamoyladenylate synthase